MASLRKKRIWVIAAIIIASSVVCGWVGREYLSVRRQHSALAAIRSLGGKAYFDYQIYYDSSDYERRFDGKWDAVKHRWFPRITLVDLSGTEVADGDLEVLKGLAGLEELDLSNTRVTGSGLTFLDPRAPLAELDLPGCPLDDAGVSQIPETVRVLDLSNTPVTDRGLAQLDLVGPNRVYLVDTNVTEEGLAQIRARHASSVIEGGESE